MASVWYMYTRFPGVKCDLLCVCMYERMQGVARGVLGCPWGAGLARFTGFKCDLLCVSRVYMYGGAWLGYPGSSVTSCVCVCVYVCKVWRGVCLVVSGWCLLFVPCRAVPIERLFALEGGSDRDTFCFRGGSYRHFLL